jgi:hypothetical protein
VIYPGSTPVGNATLVVANVLTCTKHSPHYVGLTCGSSHPTATSPYLETWLTVRPSFKPTVIGFWDQNHSQRLSQPEAQDRQRS